MGAGTLIELVARGKQDTFIIGNPNYSFFKSIYKRHTNFSIESVQNIFNEAPQFGGRSTCFIDKKGDLLNAIILEIELPPLYQGISWVNGIGNFIIDTIDLQFGGQLIDRITGQLLDIWSELITDASIKSAYYDMIGKYTTFNFNSATNSQHLYIPIPFWFCNNISQSLPLIAMQYTDISISVTFKPFDFCWFKQQPGTTDPATWSNTNPIPQIINAYLYADYIYLDTYERRKFLSTEVFQNLIEQFQMCNPIQKLNLINNISAPFFLNNPVKELIWVYKSNYALSINDHVNYGNVINYSSSAPHSANGTQNIQTIPPIYNVQLKYNGNDRFDMRTGKYFWRVQPYQRHTYGPDQYIYVFSFAVKPEELQPSGTCNFSKIDDAHFIFTFNDCINALGTQSNSPQDGYFIIYARSYNILKISSGMAGVLFSS